MRGADYVIKRVVFALVTVFIAITLNFILFRLAPGTPSRTSPASRTRRPQTRLALRKEFGLDKSKLAQYGIYLKQLAHGNLGISFANQQPVSHNLRVGARRTRSRWCCSGRSSRSSSGR